MKKAEFDHKNKIVYFWNHTDFEIELIKDFYKDWKIVRLYE